jgi:BlaI family transcriptional regulator, penicillinase repressor
MKPLTNKEEEIMEHFWEKGSMHVKELQALYDEPQPHVNTLATMVRILEEKGFLAHKAITPRYFQYYPCIDRAEYRRGTLRNVINRYFGKSYLTAVSELVKEEEVSVDELKELIRQIEQND